MCDGPQGRRRDWRPSAGPGSGRLPASTPWKPSQGSSSSSATARPAWLPSRGPLRRSRRKKFRAARSRRTRIGSIPSHRYPQGSPRRGRIDAARAMLDRVTKLVDDWEKMPSEPSCVAPVEGDKNMLMRVEHVSNNLVLAELLGILAQERLELGDRDEALRLLRRDSVECLKDEPAGLRATYFGYLGGEMYKAGDPARPRPTPDPAGTRRRGRHARGEGEQPAAASRWCWPGQGTSMGPSRRSPP